MKRLTLVISALALAGFCGQAHAAPGFYDGYGYQMPTRASKASKSASESAMPALAKKKSKKLAKVQADDGEPSPQSKKKAYKDTDGGGRPSIAAKSPAVVNLATGYGAGKIIIDQSAKKLYYTVSSTKAYAYPVAVGKEGFKWTGTKKISKEVNWPDWRPPAEMRERKPHLPEHMTGGIRNPLGAKALYLGNSLYRIHGTNDPSSIGTAASSGCIRMHNGHVVHLASVAGVGTTVHVVSKLPKAMASN